MKASVFSFSRPALTAALLLGSVGAAQAASGSWSGAEDAYWTNSANWSASPYPSGGDSATFDGDSANKAVNLAGLAGVLNITFDGGVGAYTLGAGAANSQVAILRDGGEIRLSAAAANGQTFNSSVRLGPDTANASYSLRNDNPGKTLTFSSVGGMSGGAKTLNINGVGPISFLGGLDKGSSTFDIYDNLSDAPLSVAGNSSLRILQINGTNSVINLGAGATMTISNGGSSGLMASQNCTVNGPGAIVFSTAGGNNHADNGVSSNKTVTLNARLTGATGFEYWHGSYYYGTFVLNAVNDYTLGTVINVPGTIQFSTLANRGVACNLGKGTNIVLNAVGARFLYTGTGDTSDRVIELQAGGVIEQGGTGNLKFTSSNTATSGSKTLVLQGSTTGSGEFSGAIVNSSGTVALSKEGTGAWTLSAANTYGGATLVNGGTLALSGTQGALTASASLAVSNGATLLLSNTSAANNANRLRDASAITLSGGTLSFNNDGSAADYSESAGPLVVNLDANTVAAAQAPAGRTSTLRFASLSHSADGTVNFVGASLGESDRNRIFITGQAPGLIGSWATVNGTGTAAYDSARGVYAIDLASVGIAARGPGSEIADNASAGATITTEGEAGPITLAGEWTNKVLFVRQATTTDALIATRGAGGTHKSLQTMGLLIGAGKASLTVGEAAGDGSLAALTAGGAVSVENAEPASLLTVNAPIVNNGASTTLTKDGPGKVLLAGSNSYSGATAIYAGELAFGGSATQTIAGVISGAGTLAQEGSGRLALAGANSHTGPTVARAGTLAPLNNAAFGNTVAGTSIEPGATLDVGGVNRDGLNLGAEVITVSGAGVDGRGAINNSTTNQQINALRNVTLAGDTTVGSVLPIGRWDLRNTGGTSALLMNGFTLTKVGPSYVGLTSVGVNPGAAGSIDVKEGWFTAEAGTTLGGGAANTVTVRSGAVFDVYNLSAPVAWSLVMEDRSRFYARQGNSTNLNIWAGPVTLNGLAVFDAAGTYSDTFRGDISGPGSVVKATANSTTYFTSSNNSYAGTTTISNGTLYAKYPGSLPGYASGALTVAPGGVIALTTTNGSAGWTIDQIRALHSTAAFMAPDSVLSIETTQPRTDYPYTFPVPMGLFKQGNGMLTLPENQSLRGQIKVNGGELVLNNININVTNTATYLGDATADFGKLTLLNNSTWASYLPGAGVGAPILYVGNNGRGMLTLQDNATITNRLYVGNGGSGAGAVYQRGGLYHNWCGSSSDSRIGLSGYGYYELSSGTLTNMGYFHLGQGTAGVGILAQYGGAFKQGSVYSGQLGLSRGGTGMVYLAGGTFASSVGVNVGEASDNNVNRGFADLTVDGTASAYIAGNVNMADRTNMFATVNLNGGTLTANQFTKSSSRTGSVAIVNFDGGTFCARTGGNLFNVGLNAPDAVNIYGGGATFDSTNLDVSVAVPLLAPAGSGVSGIALAPRGGYIGPPFVTISGGGGTGATAIAQFDSASGFVNGITVTCPGYGYTNTPTVSLSGGGTNVHLAATASLAPNVSGGITKLGSGMLVFNAANTFAGAVTISNGILRIGVRDALTADKDINVSGGILDLGGFSLTNRSVTASAGAIVNGTVVSDSFTKTGNGTLTLSAPIVSADPIVISGGVVKLQGVQPGLYEGVLPGNDNTTSNNPNTSVRLTTRAANGGWGNSAASGGIWVDNTTYIYSGYVWNRAETNVTWNFAENFDDTVRLKIDGTTVINGGGGWNIPNIVTNVLTPGAHAFELRLGQGSGGAGANVAQWWTNMTYMSFGVDTLGRGVTNFANFSVMTDPGDGSLFSLTAAGSTSNLLDTASSIELAAGGVLDLDTFYQAIASLSGSGTVSNGTLAVSGAIMPGGDGTLGTLTLANVGGLAGTLLVDVAKNGGSDRLAIAGNIDLSNLSLEVANPAQLNTTRTYTVATVSGTRSGTFNAVTVPDSRWHVAYRSNGDVQLLFAGGTMLKLR